MRTVQDIVQDKPKIRIKDEYGRCVECFGYSKRFGCSVLGGWYNLSDTDGNCKGCPFFKTTEQFTAERLLYPSTEEYKLIKKQRKQK